MYRDVGGVRSSPPATAPQSCETSDTIILRFDAELWLYPRTSPLSSHHLCNDRKGT